MNFLDVGVGCCRTWIDGELDHAVMFLCCAVPAGVILGALH